LKKKTSHEVRRDEHVNLFLDDELYGTDKITPKLNERTTTLKRCQGLPGLYFGDVYAEVEELKLYKDILEDSRERKRKEKTLWERKAKNRKRKKSVLHRLMAWSSLSLEITVGESK